MSELSPVDVADIVLAKLKPILEDIRLRLPDDGELKAIDAGVASALTQGAENGQKLEHLDSTMRHFADNFATLAEEVRSYHANTIDQYDRLGKRVHDLEEWRKRVENGETTLRETGGE